MRYKLFPHLFTMMVDPVTVGIFQPLTLRDTFISLPVYKKLTSFVSENQSFAQETLARHLSCHMSELCILIENGVLVSSTYSYKKDIERLGKKIVTKPPCLKSAFFIVSDACNLACSYCHIMGGQPAGYKNSGMSDEVAAESALFFSIHAERWQQDQRLFIESLAGALAGQHLAVVKKELHRQGYLDRQDRMTDLLRHVKTVHDLDLIFSGNRYKQEILQAVYACMSRPDALLYGGEALLNMRVVRMITKIIRQYDMRLPDAQHTNITLLTNGTLVTGGIAAFLKENDVFVGVSMDGIGSAPNKARACAATGKNMYRSILRGYNILRDYGLQPSVSCTIGDHNINNLSDEMAKLNKVLKPSMVGVNFPITKSNEDNDGDGQHQQYAVAFMDAYKTLRKEGIHEARLTRLFNEKGELRFRAYDCPACGDQIVFAPNGDIITCYAYLGTRQYFLGNVCANTRDIFDSSVLKVWRSRTPFTMHECYGCPAIAFCGGGCPVEAERTQGSLCAADKQMCALYPDVFLPWYLKERYFVKNKISGEEKLTTDNTDNRR